MSEQNANGRPVTGIVLAVVVFLVALLFLGLNLLLSFALAVLAFGALTFVQRAQGGDQIAEEHVQQAQSDAPRDQSLPSNGTSAPEGEAEMSPRDQEAPQASPAAHGQSAGNVKLGTLLPGEEELKAQHGAWRYDGRNDT
ncbi:hypothetical protein [Shimia sp. MMG029]|uniref:hypothetical protein n=1 Tax=Shimia sp. MMG029 TaxID=3021978 RepID=UPI0022FEEA60|nr:hypothetical protein [Shimia sp. MMG029]MDA5556023.1 hypothetical protein [Shimia sp. MMG029]